MQSQGGPEVGGDAGRHTGRLETAQENGGLQLAEEPGRMQEQGRSCKQGCSGSLGPYGFRPGSSIGLPPGKGGPKAAPNRKKSLVMQGKASHLYTVGEEMVGRRETRKRDQGQGQYSCPGQPLHTPPSLSHNSTHLLS